MPRRTSISRRSALVALGAAPAAWLGRAATAEPLKLDALEIKTALIGKIAEFVRWPPAAVLDDPARAFELATIGEGPLNAHIERYYREVRIAGHRVFVRRARGLGDIERPHLLYVAASAEPHLTDIVARLGRAPVLTVGDTDGFAQRGIAVNLYLADDQLRYEISRRALQRHGLQASYRLLNRARLIDDQQARR